MSFILKSKIVIETSLIKSYIRKNLILFDEINEKQRDIVFNLRKEIIYSDDIFLFLSNFSKTFSGNKFNVFDGKTYINWCKGNIEFSCFFIMFFYLLHQLILTNTN